jgi:hypothetical protein
VPAGSRLRRCLIPLDWQSEIAPFGAKEGDFALDLAIHVASASVAYFLGREVYSPRPYVFEHALLR